MMENNMKDKLQRKKRFSKAKYGGEKNGEMFGCVGILIYR